MTRTRIFGIHVCAPWPWPKRYDLGSRSWHTLGSWTTIVWNIIKIQLGSEELWHGHRFWVCVHCDLDLGDMTLGQDHDTPLGREQQFCAILSRSKFAVRSYGLDLDFRYMYRICALWPWPKRHDLGSRKWHTLESWTTIVWYIMKIQLGSEKLWPMCALWPWPWRYDLWSRS